MQQDGKLIDEQNLMWERLNRVKDKHQRSMDGILLSKRFQLMRYFNITSLEAQAMLEDDRNVS